MVGTTALDGVGPKIDVVRRHPHIRGKAGVSVPPLMDIDWILFPGDEGAAAHILLGRIVLSILLQSRDQFPHDRFRDFVALRRIDESEHYEMAEQHAPPGSESPQYAVPVKRRPAGLD